MTEFLRPEVRKFLERWAEMAGGVVLALIGLWVFGFGGWFFQAVGIMIGIAAIGAGVIAWRRMKFRREVDQPGLVEVDEGQIRYFSPDRGGFVAIRDLIAISLRQDAAGQSWWNLQEAGGHLLSVPVSAAGAEALFDAFATLPDIDMGALSAALDNQTENPTHLWQRKGVGILEAPS